MSDVTNDNLVLICGESTTGKSASLRNIPNPEGVMYLNCESGKKLPFRAKFGYNCTIVNPYDVLTAFEEAEAMADVHTIVVDSLSFLLEMFESVYVIPAADGRSAWALFQQFFKSLMQDKVAKSTKTVIMTAHVLSLYNETNQAIEVKVPVKGALKNIGIEAYFSCIVSCKRIPLKDLEGYSSPLLTITDEEQLVGFKHVFQTKLTKKTCSERIRSSLGMWETSETYIDNDVGLVLARLHDYYQ